MLLVLSGLRPTHDQAIKRRAEGLHVVTIGSIDDQCQGNPHPISQQASLCSSFTAIGGIGTGRGASEMSFIHLRAIPHTCIFE